MKEKLKILQFIKSKRFCVLATADKNAKPEAAIVCFFIKDDFSFLFFTDPKTRKIKNLKENNRASVVISDIKKEIEVQTDGKVTILKGDEFQKAKDFILTIAPYMKSHIEKRINSVFFQLKPNWIRYCNFSKKADEIYEEDFDGN